MNASGKSFAVVIAALLASCSGERTPDFYVRGTGIYLDSAVPFSRQADLPARLESTIGAALDYWGGSWKNLEGRTITLVDSQYVACSAPDAIGCNDGDIRVSTRDPGVGPWQCVEQTVLVHEIGHSVIDDPTHSDPRWMDFATVANRLAGRTGYTAAGDVPCEIFPSVWQHPRS